jgi:hypothetical protein
VAEPSYRVFALVRSVGTGPLPVRVGVLFLGRTPPRGYEQNPGGRYLLPTDPPPASPPRERRQHQRHEVFLNLTLRRQDPATGAVQEERTVTENLSRGGARVLTSLAVAKGEVLALEGLEGAVKTRVEIRNLYIGHDGVPRLNLQFLDGRGPEPLLAAAGIAAR